MPPPTQLITGLSPRVRGSHVRPLWFLLPDGSIPACAGEPRSPRGWLVAMWVYPRVCGGAMSDLYGSFYQMGLSPRVRGSRRPGLVHLTILGSIPACAGEPGDLRSRFSTRRVYPRVCGGALADPNASGCQSGLSPRVRA